MRRALAALGACMLALVAAPRAHALCVLCSCEIDIDALLSFGNVNPIAGPPADAVAQIDVDCFITLGAGTISNDVKLSTGAANAYTPRRMSDGAGHTLNYNLYLDNGQIWGDGTGGSSYYTRSNISLSLLHPYSYSLDVTGRIAAAGLSSAREGSYSDTITVTVVY